MFIMNMMNLQEKKALFSYGKVLVGKSKEAM